MIEGSDIDKIQSQSELFSVPHCSFLHLFLFPVSAFGFRRCHCFHTSALLLHLLKILIGLSERKKHFSFRAIGFLSLLLFMLYLLLEMKILEDNAGALTNFEVLDFLRAKGASKDPSRVLAKVAMSEYKVYDYLVNTAAVSQTRESVKEYFTVIKQHDLSEAEVLNVLNIRPASEVELYHIIEDCEERFPDEEVTEIVEKVQNTLPALPDKATPEELTKGDKETETQKHDEISQDQTEGGEQMDTS